MLDDVTMKCILSAELNYPSPPLASGLTIGVLPKRFGLGGRRVRGFGLESLPSSNANAPLLGIKV